MNYLYLYQNLALTLGAISLFKEFSWNFVTRSNSGRLCEHGCWNAWHCVKSVRSFPGKCKDSDYMQDGKSRIWTLKFVIKSQPPSHSTPKQISWSLCICIHFKYVMTCLHGFDRTSYEENAVSFTWVKYIGYWQKTQMGRKRRSRCK